MTNEERESAWREQFLNDMQKVGLKPFGLNRPPMPAPAPKPRYDPYAELEQINDR